MVHLSYNKNLTCHVLQSRSGVDASITVLLLTKIKDKLLERMFICFEFNDDMNPSPNQRLQCNTQT